MARLKIGGHTVNVDDGFKSLSPEEQQKAVEEIAASLPSKVASTAKIEPPAQDDQTAGTMQNIVRSVRGGIPFADRIAAAAKTVEPHLFDDKGNVAPRLGNGMNYAENFTNERARAQEFSKAHPFVSGAGNIAGMVATIPFTPARLLTAGDAAAPVLTRAKDFAKAGAVLGGVQGISDAPDLTSPGGVAGHAALGAGMGAALGGAAPIAGKAVGATASALSDALRGYGPELSGPAGRSLARALKTFAPGEMDETLGRLGNDATLMDTSPAFIGKAQGVSANSPEARTTLAKFLKGRSEGTSDRLLGDVQRNYGPAVSPRETQATLEEHLARTDKALFQDMVGLTPGNQNLPDVDVSDMLQKIQQALPYSEGAEKKALLTLQDRLTQTNPELANAPGWREFMPETPRGKAQDIVSFLRDLGGVRDEGGDLASQNIQKFHPGLINKNGLPMDKAREAAAEAGYLGANTDDAMSSTTINDLIDAIHNRGASIHDQELQWAKDTWKEGGGYRGARMSAQEAARAARPDERIPKTHPVNLHKIKGEIDDLIEYPDRKALGVTGADVTRSQATFKEYRNALNERLKETVPGYSEAVGESADIRGQIDANRRGYNMFGGEGKGPVWPEELQADLDAMTANQNESHRAGARARIEEKFRTTANDLTAGKYAVGGPNDFRRDLLSMRFGEDPTNNVINAVEREREFANTANRVTGNSETAQRQAAGREEAPANIGNLASIKRALIGPLMDRISERLPMSAQYYPEMAKVLSATGPERDRYIQMLAAGLQKSAATEQAATKAGDRAAILGALLGNNVARSALLPVIDGPSRP